MLFVTGPGFMLLQGALVSGLVCRLVRGVIVQELLA